MEPDTVEIAYPLTSNKDANPQVTDEMQSGGVHNNNSVDHKNKGKAIQYESPSYDEEGSASDNYGTMNNNDSYPGSSPVSNSLMDPDSLIYDDDYDYSDQYGYEMEEEEEQEEEEEPVTDEYSMLQDLYDSKDLPTGVEVSMDWFSNSDGNETAKSSGSSKSPLSDATGSSSKKANKGSGILSSSDTATPKSLGAIPNPAYSLPHNGPGFQYAGQSFTISSTTSKTLKNSLDTAMGEAQATAPAPSAPVPTHGYYKGGFKSTRPALEDVIKAKDSSRVKKNMEDYLGKYLFFKRFDIVEDVSDHYYASKGTTSKQHSKEWAKRIQEEWRILENDLPEMIFVRAYESRMDLLRAVIIGADGTPYHDGLFFFDIFFPDTYPSAPPIVHYHSGGLRINPNLYNCGKVCLSLLGTWTGNNPKEKWIPNDSTMLQVLVSIQGLILNTDPYFNEPGYERSAGSPGGQAQSKAYSENTLLLSLKTMVYNMRRPPKYFEDFSYGHFFSCAHEVLKACNAYRNGALVASLVRGAVKEGEESSQTCSEHFMKDVTNIVETLLLNEFILLGVLGLEPEQEEEEGKPSITNNVAESSSSRTTRSSSKRDRVASN